ncbi:MAG TPA: HEAT repeat domain-containing protein [Herpetosiphonaceae bacterium]
MRDVRIVIKPSAEEEDITAFAARQGWHFVEELGPTEQQPYQKIWTVPDHQTSVYYIEDFILNIRYFVVAGDQPQPVIDQIQSGLEVYSRADVLELVETSRELNRRVLAIHRVAGIAPHEFDQEIFDCLQRAMRDPEVDMRRAAIFATTYAHWPEFQASLERLQASDDDPSVRELAEHVLASQLRHDWGRDQR